MSGRDDCGYSRKRDNRCHSWKDREKDKRQCSRSQDTCCSPCSLIQPVIITPPAPPVIPNHLSVIITPPAPPVIPNHLSVIITPPPAPEHITPIDIVKQDKILPKDGSKECLTCMEAQPDVAFRPCGHIVLCSECAIALRDTQTSFLCPMCRAPITETYTIKSFNF